MKKYNKAAAGLRGKERGPGLSRDDNALKEIQSIAPLSRERSEPGRAGDEVDRPSLISTAKGGQKTAQLLILALVIIIAGCRPAAVKETVKAEPVRVRMEPVVKQEISLPVRSVGILATSEEIKLSFKTGGIVARTYFKEGDAIKKEQLMAVLNLSEINAQVNQAINGFEKAQRDFDRAKNLYTDSVATLEQMQNTETVLNVSKSILEMARFNLSHSRIVAPKNGVILRQLVKENELVAPGYPVYVLGISGKNWIIRTSLSDRDIVKVNVGDSASVIIDAWPGQAFTAVVSQIDEASNPMTGTYEIELTLSETKNRLAYGFVANVEITPGRKVSYFLVPMASVVEADGRTGYVYVVTPGGNAKKVQVNIATLYGTQAAVTSGLENVREIVGDGVAYLSDGIPVVIVQH